MAKVSIDITCEKCGNGFKHTHYCFSRSAADSYEKWALENVTTCPDCFRKQKEIEAKKEEQKKQKKSVMKRAWQIFRTLVGDRIAKLAIALKQAWAEIKGDVLKKLTGTDKQIAWAKQIRIEAVQKILAILEPEHHETFYNAVNARDTAAWWIDHRYDLEGDFPKLICKCILTD